MRLIMVARGTDPVGYVLLRHFFLRDHQLAVGLFFRERKQQPRDPAVNVHQRQVLDVIGGDTCASISVEMTRSRPLFRGDARTLPRGDSRNPDVAMAASSPR